MNPATRSEWIWRALHALSVLLVPVILTVLMGCIKAKEEKVDLGPEVPPEEIDKALSEAVDGRDISTIAAGQFVNYAAIRRLENEEATINLGYTRVSVLNRTDKADEFSVDLKIQMARRVDNINFSTKVWTEEGLTFPKTAPLIPNSYQAGELSAAGIAARAVSASAKAPTKVTYHRLRQSSGTIEVPALVKNRPGCGGISPCELPVHYLQFDLVQWFDDKSYQKLALDFAFSVKTPYLPFGHDFDQLNGLMISDCRATLIPIESRTVYVRDCLNLDDFQK